MTRTIAFAWYRFRATRRSQASHLVLVTVLVGLLGGLAMGAVAAARSTESSFTDYAARTNTSQLLRAE